MMLSGAIARAAFVSGEAREVDSDVHHPNGNIYDQVLLTGASTGVQADSGQVVRISFLDLSDDIVQVEFSGRGTMTVTLANSSGPAAPVKYNQPDVLYMKGHASISISGSDATTNVAVFSVGKGNALNQALFPAGVTYDGVADLARLEIVADPSNPLGISTFGGIRAGNVQFSATEGRTGVFAENIFVRDSVVIGDIAAFYDATPYLWLGDGSTFGTVIVAGGDLSQPNHRSIKARGFQWLEMAPGTTSATVYLPMKTFLGLLESQAAPGTAGFGITVIYPASGVSGAGSVAPPENVVTPVTPVDPGIVVWPVGG